MDPITSMKAKSLTFMLSHCESGRYREIRQWHNGLHGLELHGMVPHIYHSQDFVAPPAYMAARPEIELKWRGGECLSLYWSEGTPQELDKDVPAVSARNREAGLWTSPGGQELTYRRRMHVLEAWTRPGLGMFPDMVPLAPCSGVIISVGDTADSRDLRDYTSWFRAVYINEVLAPELCSAAFELRPMDDSEQSIVAHLYFTNASDPLVVFDAMRQVGARLCGPGADSRSLDGLGRHIVSGVYQPVMDGEDPDP